MPTAQMVKDSTYKLLLRLEKLPYFNDLLLSGIVPVNVLDYKVIYEYYLVECENEEKKTQALTNTAIEFGVSDRTVYDIIRKMRE